MKIKCDYCGNTYEDTLEKCPNCGAPNPSHQNNGQPKTIEELKDWYKKRNLPDAEVTRFFIGEDYKEPKAFGIYKDENGDFIVYKNKADGSRAVRYHGKDEEYAVNELFQKLKDEIVHQKYLNDEKRAGDSDESDRASKSRKRQSESLFDRLLVKGGIILGIMFLISTFIVTPFKNRHNGYYNYDSNIVYSYQGDWYYWDDTQWTVIDQSIPDNKTIIADIESHRDEYYMSKEWNSSYTFDNWDNSPYYQQYQSAETDRDSDRDSDYDWNSDDTWDSGGTDWDTDW